MLVCSCSHMSKENINLTLVLGTMTSRLVVSIDGGILIYTPLCYKYCDGDPNLWKTS